MATKHINRRSFLKRVAGGTAAMCFPYVIPSSALGLGDTAAPSERIVMGCIGVGGQGLQNMRSFMNLAQSQVVAVCDVADNDREHFIGREPARKIVESHYAGKQPSGTYKGCDTYGDFRELLARPDIDAVTVCTPDHWHALISVAAAKAGKDIYCEKPLANSVAEGRAVCRAVKNYGRVLQTGSQERSRPNARYACELVRNGRIGKLHTIRVNMPNSDPHHLKLKELDYPHPVLPVPEGFDYEMWQGPAPRTPYTTDRCPFFWRFHLDYGGGEMTDRGAHIIDLAQLGHGSDDTGPIEYSGWGKMLQGGHFRAFIDYGFECRYADGVKIIGTTQEPRGLKFEGDQGWIFIHVHGGKLEAEPASLLNETIRAEEIQLGRSPGHHENFIDSVIRRGEPFAPAEVGHRTGSLCHLLNIMMLTGRPLQWDPVKEQITNNELANRMLSRSMHSPWQL
jgi:predicted dehydrogenase